MLAMSLLPGCFEPATTAASMAIDRPGTIDDAPARGPEREPEDVEGRDFLVSRGMGFSPGEESRTGDIAVQSIEAQPVFGQIRPSEARCVRALNSVLGRRHAGCRLSETRRRTSQAQRKKSWRRKRRARLSQNGRSAIAILRDSESPI